MSVILQRAVEQLCREVDALRARVEALEPKSRREPFWCEEVAVRIIEGSETDVDAEVLAKMIAAGNSTPPREILKWLRTVVERGEGGPRHPLFPYLTSKKPLCFGKKPLASPAAPVQ